MRFNCRTDVLADCLSLVRTTVGVQLLNTVLAAPSGLLPDVRQCVMMSIDLNYDDVTGDDRDRRAY